ncbi:MAG: hypothetical protein OYH77_06495 [Pseudomonadota bacterium]|nr:hypothetical protein [Pseudomonadota bacterium]
MLPPQVDAHSYLDHKIKVNRLPVDRCLHITLCPADSTCMMVSAEMREHI